MSEKLYSYTKISDLKNMLNITKSIYKDKPAYKIKLGKGKYRIITHEEVREMVDYLGTALISMGLKGKRIAVIGENRYEWEIAYLAIACGTGVAVPLDKTLPDNELESLIERSGVEAIFCTKTHLDGIEKIKNSEKNNLKYIISMDSNENSNEIYSQNELIQSGKEILQGGNKEFINAEIDPDKMGVMLFTSGTTSASKVVCLSHKNICSNLMDIASVLNVNDEDVFLSILPIHHVFECTVGFLFALYKGAQTVFGDGLKHITDNIKEYNVSVMAAVPGIYEMIYANINKNLKKSGLYEETILKKEKCKNSTMEERKEIFKEVHQMLGGRVKLFISGAAALDRKTETEYREYGINLVQGYGLTETSPVVAIGNNKYSKTGSIGKTLPSIQAKIVNKNNEGIGELVVKGPNVMLGYYNDENATKAALKDGWFYTGDLAKIDEEGYIFICGRKKSVIVLKNGKNIFPEEMENLVNKIEGVNESFIFGKRISQDKENVKINVEIVFDRKKVERIYKVQTEKEIYDTFLGKVKEINKTMPQYKSIKGVILSEAPLIKTTTNKIKRQANLEAIEKLHQYWQL